MRMLKAFIGYILTPALLVGPTYVLLKGTVSGVRQQIEIQYQDSGLLILWSLLGGIVGLLVLRNFLRIEKIIEREENERRLDWYENERKKEYGGE